MTEKTLTTENIKPALDALRGELAPWPVVAKKQDRLNTAQLNAANSGITSSLVAQIIANTAAIRALESAITGTGLRALVVASLPAVGTAGILYIVPVTTYDPDTDADVVNYSNEYIWIPVEGGTASEGHYEQVGQTGIVINNGQLTITVNGTSVGTFTANQSGDTTAAITVPTNADYVDRTTDQIVAGVKTFSSTINGTAAKAIADEDGTSIKTGYVNVAGNQTVSGQKTWTALNSYNQSIQITANFNIGAVPSSEVSGGFNFGNGTSNIGSITARVNSGGATHSRLYIGNKFANGALDPNGTWKYAELQVGLRANGDRFIYTDGLWRNNLTPYESTLNLGTSTNKWKTLNGVNPGALSLPDYDSTAKVDISGSIIPDQYGNIRYTPPINGWLYVCFDISNATTSDSIFYIQAKDNNVANSSFVQTSWMPTSGTSSLAIFFPVVANKRFVMQINFSNYTIIKAHVIPCLGNV